MLKIDSTIMKNLIPCVLIAGLILFAASCEKEAAKDDILENTVWTCNLDDKTPTMFMDQTFEKQQVLNIIQYYYGASYETEKEDVVVRNTYSNTGNHSYERSLHFTGNTCSFSNEEYTVTTTSVFDETQSVYVFILGEFQFKGGDNDILHVESGEIWIEQSGEREPHQHVATLKDGKYFYTSNREVVSEDSVRNVSVSQKEELTFSRSGRDITLKKGSTEYSAHMAPDFATMSFRQVSPTEKDFGTFETK